MSIIVVFQIFRVLPVQFYINLICNRCRLVVVTEWYCHLRNATLGPLFYPRVIAMWTLMDKIG